MCMLYFAATLMRPVAGGPENLQVCGPVGIPNMPDSGCTVPVKQSDVPRTAVIPFLALCGSSPLLWYGTTKLPPRLKYID
ncbi:hypothetical protein F4823DRAFT_587406 [Ustulina deusta]|nr:hypothetical protein F4823DRAFT_587406 [Ustulina deusta]